MFVIFELINLHDPINANIVRYEQSESAIIFKRDAAVRNTHITLQDRIYYRKTRQFLRQRIYASTSTRAII